MQKYIVAKAFHITPYPDGEEKSGKDVHFAKGAVITATDVPEGWTAEQWETDGLIVAPAAVAHDGAT